MQRQIFWWQQPVLPTEADIEALSTLDGVLIDTQISETELFAWQDRFEEMAEDIPHICFSDVHHQKRWMLKIASEEYAKGILNYPI
jgi:hypothetical protein